MRTVKIKITTEGLGGTKPLLLRFNLHAFGVTRDLENFCNFGENIETWWPHFKKKVLETFVSNDYTRKFKLNSIDFKINFFFLKFESMNAQTMYQGKEVQEDGEDTDKGYNSY